MMNNKKIELSLLIILSISFPISYQQSKDNDRTIDPWSFGTTDLIAIIAILIPTGIGAYTSKYISNEWQKRKEKRDIKRQIIQDFDDSIVKYSFSVQSFFRQMFNSYVIINENAKIESGKVTNSHTIFPDSADEQPRIRFKKEYAEFGHDTGLIFNAIWKFESAVQFYCKDVENIKKETDRIIIKSREALLEVQKMYFATNKQDYKTHSDIYGPMHADLQIELMKFRKLLLDVKIKDSIFHK